MPGMRTWILLSTFALALPLAACGDDTGGAGGGGGDDSSSSTSGTTSASGSTSGTPTTTGGSSGAAPTITVGACASAAATIGTDGLAFSPSTATISAGQSIQFESGTVVHSMKGDTWETADGGTACLTFAEAGDYDFVCGIHPSMTGSIKVQ